jgi:F0F1-type ATP synthase assembly protein I
VNKYVGHWKNVGDGLQMGGQIVISIILGAAIGWWIDGKLGTFPWLSIVFFLFGIVAAGQAVWREVRKQLQADKGNKPNT